MPNSSDSSPGMAERIDMALTHCQRLVDRKGEKKAMPEMRKHLAWYLKGLPRTAALKGALFRCTSLAEASQLMRDYSENTTPRSRM